jgi:hypothetical protein
MNRHRLAQSSYSVWKMTTSSSGLRDFDCGDSYLGSAIKLGHLSQKEETLQLSLYPDSIQTKPHQEPTPITIPKCALHPSLQTKPPFPISQISKYTASTTSKPKSPPSTPKLQTYKPESAPTTSRSKTLKFYPTTASSAGALKPLT